MVTLDIQEALTLEEGRELRKLAQSVARPGAVFIEVGSWKGYSASFLGQVAKECGGHLYCVDPWVKSPLDLFWDNMKALRLTDHVHPLMMRSAEAASIIDNHRADLVFIDADHMYPSVREDIMLWRRKVRSGGILCGHDGTVYYTGKYKQDIDANIGLEYIIRDGQGIHPGVVKALDNAFKESHSIIQGTSIWCITL